MPGSEESKKEEPEVMEEPGFLKNISTEANEIAVAVRKAQQNNKVLALKNKFRPKVKLVPKIETDEAAPRNSRGQASTES